MKIQVTPRDIKYGIPWQPNYCPLARALKRVFKTRDVSVGLGYIRIRQSFWNTPQEAKTFIDAIDFGEPAQPFEFKLDKRKTIRI